jgi:hypothetical protein
MGQTGDFSCGKLDRMIDLNHRLALFSSRMSWQEIEVSSVGHLARKVKSGKRLERPLGQASGHKEKCLRQIKELQGANGEAMLELRAGKKGWNSCWAAKTSDSDRQAGIGGAKGEGFDEQAVPVVVVPRRSVYCKPTKSGPRVQERLERPIKDLIEQDPLRIRNLDGPFEHEQEHQSAELPDPRLAGQKASDLR